METNLKQTGQNPKLPAGMFVGVELFAHQGQIYAIYQGKCMQFNELPVALQKYFFDAFSEDKKAHLFFRTMGMQLDFQQWLFCRFGALDGEPDLVRGKVNPDRFNNVCLKMSCPGRGRICSKLGLKSYQVATLKELKTGKSMKEVAEALCVSEHTVKSRVENMKVMFNATNIVALMATAVDFGL